MKNALRELLAGFIIGVIAFWFVEYNVRELYGIPLKYIIMVGSAIAVFGFAYYLNKEILKAIFFVLHGILVAQLARVFYDISIDSTTHNLIPFELFDTILRTAIGGLIGGGVSLFLKRPRTSED